MSFDVTVDRGDLQWSGTTGVVTRLLSRLYCRPERSIAMLCGPEVMLRSAARELIQLGYPADSIYASAERNMHCGVGSCGRCQLGPHFICKDGPVFRYDALKDILAVREL
jgi:anaerobic sulfite reductase subunit B